MSKPSGESAWSDGCVTCPYCGHLRHDDLYDFSENDVHHVECGKCEREFTVTTYTSISYTSYPMDDASRAPSPEDRT